MKNNALFPYAIIAIIGVVLVIVMSTAGSNQRETMNSEGDDVEEATVETPEGIFTNSCASCHGDDLSGGFGPALENVGSSMNEEEIQEIIKKGRGSMPAETVSEDQAEIVAEWLVEEHK